MSFVVLQVGQCGNQLGHSFFSTLSEVVNQKTSDEELLFDETFNRFFSSYEEKNFARSVLIDTEPKVAKRILKSNLLCSFTFLNLVIEEILNSNKKSFWHYQDDCAIRVHELGSGNNWAMGYYCNGASVQEKVIDMVRQEAERSDYLNGFLQFSSVAGGTGSGLGSYLAEHLQDEFSSTSTANIIVWPFQKGDITIQAYNCVLSLASLQKSSDAIFLFENDRLMKQCKLKEGLKNVSLHHLNEVASRQLSSLFLPIEDHLQTSINFNDLLGHLVPHSQFKLVNLFSAPQEPFASIPFSVHTWKDLLRSLRRMILYDSFTANFLSERSPPVSIANLLILKGRDCNTVDPDILQSVQYSSWAKSRLMVCSHLSSFLHYDRSVVLANNGQFSNPNIDATVAKAWNMFSHKAYFHHYEECGLSAEEFKQAIMNVEQIIACYNQQN